MSDPRSPRSEPEIIPPGAPLPRREPRVWVSDEASGMHQVYVRPIGPVGVALLTLAGGAIAAVALVFLFSVAFFGLAAIGALTLIGIIAGLLRGPSRSLR
jgi:hypothetical protein